MRKPESCSESRMRSRTSREVPEWSGGEELYIGSPVSATGKVSGVIGIVPGPPEGSRGSTGWGHLSRRAPWAEVGGEPAPSGLVRPPLGPLRLGLETLGVGAPPLGLEGSRIHALGASLSTCYTSPSRRSSAKPCRDPLHPPPRRRAIGSPSTSPSPLLDQEGGDVAAPYVC